MRDPNSSGTVLEARGLTMRFGNTLALDRLNLRVGPGEVVCLLGANGAGKTTTLNLFLGFLEPSDGEVRVAGRSVSADPAAARSALGYVAEVVSLYPTLTGRENLDFFHALSGQPPIDDARRDRLLADLDFPIAAIDRRVSTYSKGMRQKLGLGIAVAKGARAILLDEPLSGLDPRAANNLVGVLRRLADGGTALLISTHDILRATAVADRIGIMAGGRLLELREAASLSAEAFETLYLGHMSEHAA